MQANVESNFATIIHGSLDYRPMTLCSNSTILMATQAIKDPATAAVEELDQNWLKKAQLRKILLLYKALLLVLCS